MEKKSKATRSARLSSGSEYRGGEENLDRKRGRIVLGTETEKKDLMRQDKRSRTDLMAKGLHILQVEETSLDWSRLNR